MLTDVIVAPATPLGRSAIAMVRVTGRDAHRVAGSVLKPFEPAPARTARKSSVVRPTDGELLDEVVYVSYRAPRSYTGEDMVEISTHGGLLIPGDVVGALLTAGAREAMPGEFTRRALLNGKLDLLQAEAVGDLVAATTPVQRRAALGQLDRSLSVKIGVLRDQVLELETLCCYEIDFPEEDGGPVSQDRINNAIAAVQGSIADILATADAGERLRDGALCVIAGSPNVGKSTLFNALLASERAIVTETPGTTRDAIEAPATFEGFPFRLVDTAGLRDTRDAVERIGVEVSRSYLEKADIVLYCSEAASAESNEVPSAIADLDAPCMTVCTKADLLKRGAQNENRAGAVVYVSALTGEGLPDLRNELVRSMFAALTSSNDQDPIITRTRHRVSLETALLEIGDFGSARARGVETAVAATHLRAAVTALETLVGLVTPEDVLDHVFSRFCIGK